MTNQARHTVIRISLRSMLAITFGVAVIMAVAGPYIKEMEPEQQEKAFYAFLLFAFGMVLSIANSIRRRKNVVRKAGVLLVSFPAHSNRSIFWARWFWLLAVLPLIFLGAGIQFNAFSASSSASTYFLIFTCVLSMYWGNLVGKWGLLIWTEGSGNTIEFCENGIAIFDQFYEWSSPKIRNLRLMQHSNKLMLHLQHFRKTILVPKEEKEKLRTALHKHYQPPKSQSPFDDA